MDQHIVLVVSDNVSLSDLKELSHLIGGNLQEIPTENKTAKENEGNVVSAANDSNDVKAAEDCISALSTTDHSSRPSRKTACPSKYEDQTFVNDKKGAEEEDDNDYTPKKKLIKSKQPRKSRDNGDALERTQRNAGIYLCQICSKTFRQKGNLKAHLRVHTDDKPFTCPVCRKGFKSKEALLRHQYIHTGKKPYSCSTCSQGFSSSLALKEHKARHNNQILYKCQVCNRGFRHTSALKRHLTVHSDATPFSCDVCNRKFSQKSYLRSHQRSHTGERPFSCDKCGKRFAHLSDVSRHKIIHTGKKPFVCKHCGSSFSDPSSHRRHEREHTDGKTFRCESCSQQFKRAVQLKNHMSKAHNIELHDSSELICVEQVNESDVSVMFIREDCEETSDKCEFQLNDINLETEACAVDGMENTNNCPLPDKLTNTDANTESENINYSDDVTVKKEVEFSQRMDFVKNPDFTCQAYYDWLSSYTSHVSSLVAPLNLQTFFDISHVHKTLANVLAQPTKVLINKKNFQIMLDIMNNLHNTMTEHLGHVLSTLSDQ